MTESISARRRGGPGGQRGCGGAALAAAVTVLLVVVLAGPAAAGITLFSPSSSSIASAGVLDFAEGMNGEIYVATDAGLSVFNNRWETLRTTTPLANGSILSNHVLAVETDHRGFVWVGYPDGLQILSGPVITTIRDQQFLKNLNINTLYRNGEEMWVATGSSGVHLWHNGTWSHVSPLGEEGLEAYEIRSMAADPDSGALYLASSDNGVWVAGAGRDPLRFTRLMAHVPGDSTGAKLCTDPFGGIYLFNRTTILHYSDREGLRQVRFGPDLVAADVTIYDMTIARSGIAWLATGNGIYGCADGKVTVHLTAPDGIGSDAVKRIYADRQGRIWFVTPQEVGILPSVLAEGTPIPVHISGIARKALSTDAIPTGAGELPLPPTPVVSVTIFPGPETTSQDPFPQLFTGISRWLGDLFPEL